MAATKKRVVPREGQESVWDYPRPPACVPSLRVVTVTTTAGRLIADTNKAWRVLETSHPPTWYLPPDAVVPGILIPSSARSTMCEWKGAATYWDLDLDLDLGVGAVLAAAAWSYEHPSPGFEQIAGFLAFTPSRLICCVDGEQARPQEGGFYAGWITDDVVGPFKGGPGTIGW
jgi:uncharacterized protein (DUF427 family)